MFPGLTDIHAHPAMNAFLWDRDLRRHYFTGKTFNPLASLTDFKMLEKGGVKVLWSSNHIPERSMFDCKLLWVAAHLTRGGRMLLKNDAWECLLAMMAQMERQVARAGDRFEVARSNAELDDVLAARKTAIVHTVEGGHVLGAGLENGDLDGRLERVDELAERGVASITIAHLFPNELAGHAEAIPAAESNLPLCHLDSEVDLSLGLKRPAGPAVVERMVERRILPDVMHCTPRARRDVYAQVANRIPIVGSHSGVQALNPEPYNLDREDVEAIVASGGLIGVIFMPYWLAEEHPGPGLEAIWETMDELRAWSGDKWDHVAIGTDFDGFTDPPDDCDSSAKLPVIRDLLERKGLSQADVEKVLGGNARRVLQAGWR